MSPIQSASQSGRREARLPHAAPTLFLRIDGFGFGGLGLVFVELAAIESVYVVLEIGASGVLAEGAVDFGEGGLQVGIICQIFPSLIIAADATNRRPAGFGSIFPCAHSRGSSSR